MAPGNPYYKKGSDKPTVTYRDAVDEALCFGWIDSVRRSIDEESFIQYFSMRKPKSVWSKINKEKVERLIEEGLMSRAGFESIEIAKQNGYWAILEEVEKFIIPDDLETAFTFRSGSKDYFLSLNKSMKKAILQWVLLAKRPETRQKRITKITESAVQGLKPKQFR